MSIKKYEVLLQTADLGSFTKASEVLGYTCLLYTSDAADE